MPRPARTRPAASVRAAQKFWQLPENEIEGLLTLTRQADRVELKLIVPATAHRSTCGGLGIDFTRASTRRVYYLDTPDKALHDAGVVARIRSRGGRADDAVVKLRPLVPASLPAALRRSKDFVVEVDGMPGGYVCSGALKTRLGPREVARAMACRRPLRTLFTKRQLWLLGTRLPGQIEIDD